jgi:hypothetical protein
MTNQVTPASQSFRDAIRAQMAASDDGGLFSDAPVAPKAPVARYTDAERRLLRRWQGLADSVLRELIALDADAIARQDRFADQRAGLIVERELVISTRARLGVDENARLSREGASDGN